MRILEIVNQNKIVKHLKTIVFGVLLLFVAEINSVQTKASAYLNILIDYVACIGINDAVAVGSSVNSADKGRVNSIIIPENEQLTRAFYIEFQMLSQQKTANDTLKFFVEGVFNNKQKYSTKYRNSTP